MAAGTGGHIFPGLAIAAALKEKDIDVSWLGTTTGMEQSLVPKYGIPMDTIAFTGVRGKGLAHTLKGVAKMIKSFIDCVAFIRARRPDVILGMGGYVTVPGGVAAKLLGVPLVLVNADAGLLLSNKVLAPFARRVCFGFEPSYKLTSGKLAVTGNPVRNEIIQMTPPDVRYRARSGPVKILVVGGSLGAKALNELLPQALALIPQEQRPLVTHQTGKGHSPTVIADYDNLGVEASITEFIDDMPSQYANADVVICRAGAITLSELTAAGVASILVPLVASTTSHQRDNADWLSRKGGSMHLPQKHLTPEALAKVLMETTREQWMYTACLAFEQRRHSATANIVDVLQSVSK